MDDGRQRSKTSAWPSAGWRGSLSAIQRRTYGFHPCESIEGGADSLSAVPDAGCAGRWHEKFCDPANLWSGGGGKEAVRFPSCNFVSVVVIGFALHKRKPTNHEGHEGTRRKQMESTLAALLVLILLTGWAHSKEPTTPDSSNRPGWTLTWSDEFNQPDGSAPDPAKWRIETGGNGWGNKELEYYTNRPQNLHVRNGNLEMIALKEHYTGADGVT